MARNAQCIVCTVAMVAQTGGNVIEMGERIAGRLRFHRDRTRAGCGRGREFGKESRQLRRVGSALSAGEYSEAMGGL